MIRPSREGGVEGAQAPSTMRAVHGLDRPWACIHGDCVLSDSPPLSPGRSILRLGYCRVDFQRAELVRGDQVVPLTSLEAKVLHYLAERPERLVSREELLVQVWHYRVSATTRAPSLLLSRLRKKLGDPSLLRTIRGQGYILRAGEWLAPEPPSEETPELPDASFATSLATLQDLRARKRTLQERAPQPDDLGILARLELAWLGLLSGETLDIPNLWRDVDQASDPGLQLRCGLLALLALEQKGIWPAVLTGADQVQAIEGLSRWDQGLARGLLSVLRCTANARLGQVEAARSAAAQACVIAETLRHPKLLALAYDRRAFLARRSHQLDEAVQLSRDAQRFLAETDCVLTWTELTNNRGTLHYLRGEMEQAAQCYEEALALAQSWDGHAHSLMILGSLVSVRLNQGRIPQAQAVLDQLANTPSPATPRQQELRISYHQGRIALERRDWPRAQEALERSAYLAASLGDRRLEGYSRLYLAWIPLQARDWEQAWCQLQTLPAQFEGIQDIELVGVAWLWQAWCAQATGRPSDASLQQAHTLLQSSHSPLQDLVGGSAGPGQGFLRRRCETLKACLPTAPQG